MQEQIANDVQISKEKDDKRGARVIKDYPEAHKPASEDAFVKETWEQTNRIKKEIQNIIGKIWNLFASSSSIFYGDSCDRYALNYYNL